MLNAPAGTYTQLTAGGQHSCALRSDGAIECWGVGSEGETTVP